MRRHDPPDGFAEFVTARSGALRRAAWALTGDRTSAEDLLQTALAEVWPKWARISAGSPVRWTAPLAHTPMAVAPSRSANP